MKNILYIFVAAALVTILPFLTTFEKGQNIVRGLFEYGIFAILLFYVYLKGKCKNYNKFIAAVVCYILLIAVSWIDLQTILFVKGRSTGFYGIIPFVGSFFALVLLHNVKGFSLHQVYETLFICFFAHFVSMRIYPDQPLFQFSVPLYLEQQNQPIDRNLLTKEFQSQYKAIDSSTITRYHVGASRSNVVILVESWGVPMDSVKLSKELAVFRGLIRDKGIHHRMYSRTRTAEREDLLDSAWRDSIGRRDSLFMPNRFATLGYKTSFLFGGDSTIQWRYKYIRNIGFQETIWMDSATADAVMATKIDSLLGRSDSVKHFIAWTTRDTRFPISDDPIECENLYYERLFGTLRIIADLAKRHPEVRFVVQGDHEPILSPLEFQRKFYKRWVPYVVLN